MTTTDRTIQINLPGSKSEAARALVCRLLSCHDTRIENLPDCDDTNSMLRLTTDVRRAMEAGSPTTVNIGEGGTTLRFGMAACASLAGLDITLIGSHRLMERPHAILIDALSALGADIDFHPEEDAIHIKGKQLCGGEIELDGSISSQYLSAMMLAAPVWEKDTVFRLRKPVVSHPYISMTAAVMRAFGAKVETGEHDDCLQVRVLANGYAQCARYDVESDWSGASYFFETRLILEAIGKIAPEMTFPFLKAPVESMQGDSRIAEIFAEATHRLRAVDNSVMTMNLNEAPDLVPAITVGLSLSGIHFRIEGVAHLKHKESDRMAALSTEMHRLGYVIDCSNDAMEWSGKRCVPETAPLIRTYRDHRMAMAFAPAKSLFPDLQIEDPSVVTKSFPTYWQQLEKLDL